MKNNYNKTIGEHLVGQVDHDTNNIYSNKVELEETTTMISIIDHIQDGIAEIGNNKVNIDIGMVGNIEIRNHNLIHGIGIGNTSHNVLLELDTSGTITA